MSQKYSTRAFKDLKDEWYAKLKKEGFEDIEVAGSSKEYLKEWHSNYFIARYSPLSFESKQEYYSLASAFIHRHRFKTQQEKRIWLLHTEGLSIKTIAETLKIKKWKAEHTIQALKRLMLKFA